MTYQIQTTFSENFKIINDTNISKQSLTTSYAVATGSEISYVPSPSTSFVIYHYSVGLFADTGSSGEKNATFKLQYSNDNGANWSDWGDNTEVFLHSAGTIVRIRSVIDVKFCISASGWNSNKDLRLVVLEDSGSDTALHQWDQSFLDDSSSYSSQRYFPSISCYSVS